MAPIRSRSAQLTVYVPPEDPFIVQGEALELTEDMDTTLECVSPGGKPAADVSRTIIKKKQTPCDTPNADTLDVLYKSWTHQYQETIRRRRFITMASRAGVCFYNVL